MVTYNCVLFLLVVKFYAKAATDKRTLIGMCEIT